MSPDAVVWMLRLVFAGLAVGAVVLFVLRPMLRLLREKPDASLLTRDFTAQFEEDELEIPTDGAGGPPDKNEIVRLLREDPQQAALLIQNWIRERK